MKQTREILVGALSLSLLATVFCVWTALGNDVNFCVTTGCSLYQDFSMGGFSLWWLGAIVFLFLAALALLGAAELGRFVAGLALLVDVGLLLIMALTAPCISCMVVAVFFALIYLCFRHAVFARDPHGPLPRRSVICLLWLLLFAVNLGAVARSQMDVWPIMEAGDEVRTRLFFSPSCASCRQGVMALSGRIDVAYYPLAENDADIYKTARMQELLEAGQSPIQALEGAEKAEAPAGLGLWRPTMLWLRFRMLCNKAHVLAAGVQTVPFVEFHGLPSALAPKVHSVSRSARSVQDFPVGLDHTLPLEPLEQLEPLVSGQCGGEKPCP